jgi:hypothetical protein
MQMKDLLLPLQLTMLGVLFLAELAMLIKSLVMPEWPHGDLTCLVVTQVGSFLVFCFFSLLYFFLWVKLRISRIWSEGEVVMVEWILLAGNFSVIVLGAGTSLTLQAPFVTTTSVDIAGASSQFCGNNLDQNWSYSTGAVFVTLASAYFLVFFWRLSGFIWIQESANSAHGPGTSTRSSKGELPAVHPVPIPPSAGNENPKAHDRVRSVSREEAAELALEAGMSELSRGRQKLLDLVRRSFALTLAMIVGIVGILAVATVKSDLVHDWFFVVALIPMFNLLGCLYTTYGAWKKLPQSA